MTVQIALAILSTLLSLVALRLGVWGLGLARRRQSDERRDQEVRRLAHLEDQDGDVLTLAHEHVRLWWKWAGQSVLTLLVGVLALLVVALPDSSLVRAASGLALVVAWFGMLGWLIVVEVLTLREQAQLEQER